MLAFLKRSTTLTKERVAAAVIFAGFFFLSGLVGSWIGVHIYNPGLPSYVAVLLSLLAEAIRILLLAVAAGLTLWVFRRQKFHLRKRDAIIILALITWLGIDKIWKLFLLPFNGPTSGFFSQNGPGTYVYVIGCLLLTAYILVSPALEFIFTYEPKKRI